MGVLEAIRSRGNDLRPQAEINVTPLVDVMLVLLIVFMVTAPMLTAGLPVDLPKATTAHPLERSEPIVVTLDRDGNAQLGDKGVAVDGLGDAILTLTAGDRTRAIHVRADRECRHGAVVAVLDQLGAHGLSRIAILTERAPGGRAPRPDDKPSDSR